MRSESPIASLQLSLFSIVEQLDVMHPLMALSRAYPWAKLENDLAGLYSKKGRKAKPIRLMCGLLLLKQMYNLSDESVVEQWCMNPYYQVFCGEVSFQIQPPCHSTELVKFRQRIGAEGVKKLFEYSVKLHNQAAEEETVLIDTTVQEKAITYPTDSKLAIKIINRLNKLAKVVDIKQRRTFVKEVKALRLACRNFRHVKRKGKARRALSRLRTIAGILLRELQRKLPESILEQEKERFSQYQQVLSQKPNDKNKIYSLHEPDIYCVGKGKDHKPYEYGRKASIVSTLTSKIIVGVVSHDEHTHDSKTFENAVAVANQMRVNPITTAVVDRGYRGVKKQEGIEIVLPGLPLKRDSEIEKKRKRALCKSRSGIEPIIGHLKQDYRLTRNWLKGSVGDSINLFMAACAWNLRKWMAIFFVFESNGDCIAFAVIVDHQQCRAVAYLRLV